MKKLLGGMIGLTAMMPLAGATLGAIGSTMTGAISGIGSATQSMVAIAPLSYASKMFKWK